MVALILSINSGKSCKCTIYKKLGTDMAAKHDTFLTILCWYKSSRVNLIIQSDKANICIQMYFLCDTALERCFLLNLMQCYPVYQVMCSMQHGPLAFKTQHNITPC